MYKPLRPDDILEILDTTRGIFDGENIVVEVDSSDIFFIGDIHADLSSATKIYRLIEKTKSRFIFLGDYVDRGEYGVETIIGLFRLKIKDPERILLLRGNHETVIANEQYGFLTELQLKYKTNALYLYNEFNKTFSRMPVASIVNSEILCVHGGIPKGYRMSDIRKIEKGDMKVESDILLQILWNDPDESIEYFAPSFRGPGVFLYGKKAFEEFMNDAGLKRLIRAHTFLIDGAQWYFNKRLLSIFSSINYVGQTVNAKIAKLTSDKIKVINLLGI